MPNHVSHHFAMSNLTEKQKEILNKIQTSHYGMCGYYLPMPEDLRETTSPPYIVSEREYKRSIKENAKIDLSVYTRKPITKKMQTALLEKYGYDNWYHWACDIWGTKWGCYDNDIDGETYTCTTAWSPMRQEIVELFLLDFPNFTWHWEEEQGYGATYVFENGELIESDEYEYLDWNCIASCEIDGSQTDICYTPGRPETLSTEVVQPGFYADYSEHEFLGDTLPMDIFDKLSEDEQNDVLKFYNK